MKRIVLHFIQARPGHHAAGLGFFSEREQIGQHVEMLAAPHFTGSAHAALDFVEN